MERWERDAIERRIDRVHDNLENRISSVERRQGQRIDQLSERIAQDAQRRFKRWATVLETFVWLPAIVIWIVLIARAAAH